METTTKSPSKIQERFAELWEKDKNALATPAEREEMLQIQMDYWTNKERDCPYA